MKRSLAIGAIAAVTLAAPAARAESGKEIFARALEAAKSGDNATACKLFKESYRAEPLAGTLMNVAICLEDEGDLVDAFNAFNDARERAIRDGKSERATTAREHLETLAPKVARVVVKNPEALAGRMPWLDGQENAALSTRAVAVAPGPHAFELRGGVRWTAQLDAVTGVAREIVIPRNDEATEAAPKPATAALSAPSSETTTQRTAAFALGGVGVAALAAGGVFGVLAFGKKSDAKSAFAANGDADAANRISDQGRTLADVATIASVVGVAALAGGIVLFVNSPARAASASVSPTLGIGEVGLRGAF